MIHYKINTLYLTNKRYKVAHIIKLCLIILNIKPMEDINKFLNKIPIDKLYEDLFQPSLKKAGEALATVLDLSNSILLPIKLINEKSKLVFTKNMKRYQEKLDSLEPINLIQVPEFVGIPILDKLTYLSEHNISEAFINLLAQSSNDQTLKNVHPSFLSILNDLSSDEAKLLFYLKDCTEIAFIDIYVVRELEKIKKPINNSLTKRTIEELKLEIAYELQDRHTTQIRSAWNLTGLEKKVKLDFPENIDLYLYNLEKHKIFEYDRENYSKNLIDNFLELENIIYLEQINEYTKYIDEFKAEPKNEYLLSLNIRRGRMEFTNYGIAFIKTCMYERKNEC